MDAERQAARAFGVPRPEERRATPHLRSLSSYSRRIVCESADGWPSFSHSLQAPFCNMKIKIVNSQPPPPLSGKRRLDVSALEEGGSTPPRKRLALSASTPGLGAPRTPAGTFGQKPGPPLPFWPRPLPCPEPCREGRGGGRGGRKEPLSLDEGYFAVVPRGAEEKARGRWAAPGGQPPAAQLAGPGGGAAVVQSRAGGCVRGGALPSPALCRNLLSCLDDAAQPGAAGRCRGWRVSGRGRGLAWGPPFESWLRRGSFSEGDREAGGRGMTVKVELAERTWPSPCKENTGSPGDKGEPSNSAQLSPVQVRSVVVVPQKRADQDDAKSGREHLRRPVVYDREADWEREKELYVAAVTSHMADSTPCGGGVMTELVNLMKTVARQGVGNGNEPWQHPSDLTRRNYGGGAGKARISLDEWQQRNRTTHCRFADVPEFQRTPVPQSRSA
ncbi:hypothetical protein ANANG_G00003880 [Anguilla anguilla]|uniref:S100P-binding protein n=1 Tax=Anguilla anguilla TaxID=7936 RepID=A0A9D3MYC0_ANGAN|nr:hypothetical protein ANANG_G00003880 [Anguilla anguilla]